MKYCFPYVHGVFIMDWYLTHQWGLLGLPEEGILPRAYKLCTCFLPGVSLIWLLRGWVGWAVQSPRCQHMLDSLQINLWWCASSGLRQTLRITGALPPHTPIMIKMHRMITTTCGTPICSITCVELFTVMANDAFVMLREASRLMFTDGVAQWSRCKW